MNSKTKISPPEFFFFIRGGLLLRGGDYVESHKASQRKQCCFRNQAHRCTGVAGSGALVECHSSPEMSLLATKMKRPRRWSEPPPNVGGAARAAPSATRAAPWRRRSGREERGVIARSHSSVHSIRPLPSYEPFERDEGLVQCAPYPGGIEAEKPLSKESRQ